MKICSFILAVFAHVHTSKLIISCLLVLADESQLKQMARKLSVHDVAEFLKEIKLGNLVKLFCDNDVDGKLLQELSDDDLLDLGVKNGFQRRKIISKFETHLLELINKQEQ